MARRQPVPGKGALNPEDALRLQQNAAFIESHVDGKSLTSSLLSDLIIDQADGDLVSAGKTGLERTRTLLNILGKCGPKAYHGFLRALRSNGYGDVASVIEDKEAVSGGPAEVKEEEIVKPAHAEKRQLCGLAISHVARPLIGRHCDVIDSLITFASCPGYVELNMKRS